MKFAWPQVAVLVWFVASVTLELVKHGQPKEHAHDFWTGLIAYGLLSFVLYMGGFWQGRQ